MLHVHTHIRIEQAIYLQSVNGFVHIRMSCAGRQNIARIGVLEGFFQKNGRAMKRSFFCRKGQHRNNSLMLLLLLILKSTLTLAGLIREPV